MGCRLFEGDCRLTEQEEICQNPWKPECKRTDIVVVIIHRYKKCLICKVCWNEIADSDKEWGRRRSHEQIIVGRERPYKSGGHK